MEVNARYIVAVFTAVLGMFMFGFNSTIINAPQSEIEKFINESFSGQDLSKAQSSVYFSVMVSLFLAGGMLGAFTGGWVGELLGRRNGLLAMQAPVLLGAVLMGCCKVAGSYGMLVAGRFFVGYSCGAFTAVSPTYVSEITPVRIRGAIGTINQLATTFGLLAGFVLGIKEVLGGADLWPLALALTSVPSVLMCGLLPFMPESPRYLVISKGSLDRGIEAMSRIRSGSANVAAEIEEIKRERPDESGSSGSTDKPGSQRTATFRELLSSPRLYMALFVSLCLHMSQQFSGMVAIFYYSTSFFQKAGVPCDVSQFTSIFVGVIMVLMTFVSIPLMDRMGRKTLHLIGLAGLTFCSILITIGLSLPDAASSQQDCSVSPSPEAAAPVSGVGIFVIASTLAFVVFFAIGPGSIPWMAVPELFTQQHRAPAISLVVLVNWLSNLLVGLTFPSVAGALDNLAFLPFLASSAIFFVLLFLYFPELKGRTSHELSAALQARHVWTKPLGLRKAQTSPLQQEGHVAEYGSIQSTIVS